MCDAWSRNLSTDFTLDNCLFESLKLNKNSDPDKYRSSGYGIRLDARSRFLWADVSWGKNFITFRVDNGSSLHVDNKKIYPMQRLGNVKIIAEVKYPINFTELQICYLLFVNESIHLLIVSIQNKCAVTKPYPLFRYYFKRFYNK